MVALSHLCYSQEFSNSRIDSLHAVAAEFLLDNNNDSAVAILQQSLEESIQSGYDFGKARALSLSACFYNNRSLIDTAEFLFNQSDEIYQRNNVFGDSLESKYTEVLRGIASIQILRRNFERGENLIKKVISLYRNAGDKEQLATSLTIIGRSRGIQDDFTGALEYFNQILALDPDDKIKSFTMNGVSICYQRMGFLEKAKEYLLEGIAIDKKNNWIQQTSKLNNLSSVYKDLGQLDSAVYYGQQAYEAAKRFKRYNSAIIALKNLAKRYVLINENLSIAKEYMEEALALSDSTGIPTVEGDFDMVMAGLFLKDRENDSAIFYAKRAFGSTVNTNNLRYSAHLSGIISTAYENKKVADSALHYYRLYQSFEDSLFNKDNQKKFTKLYAQVETLEKQKEIDLLETQKVIDAKNRALLIVSIVAILIVAIAIILIMIYRARVRQREQFIQGMELRNEIRKREHELQKQTLHMININNNMTEVEESIRDLKKQKELSNGDLQKVLNTIMVNKSMEKEWEVFEEYFANTHSDFNGKLTADHKLSQNDRRLSSLIKMGLGNREIAGILNIEQRSVIMNRYRLKKKLNLSEEEDLETYINSIG